MERKEKKLYDGLEIQQKNDRKELPVQEKTPPKRKKSGACDFPSILKAVVVFGVFVVLLGGVAFGVVWFLDNEGKLRFSQVDKPEVSVAIKNAEEKVNTPEIEAIKESSQEEKSSDTEKEETPTSADEDIATLSVLVLNAGGAGGSAGKVAEALKSAGYTQARPDNADGSGYSGLTVAYGSKDAKGTAEKIAEALQKTYSNVTTKEASSADEKKDAFVVMVGRN